MTAGRQARTLFGVWVLIAAALAWAGSSSEPYQRAEQRNYSAGSSPTVGGTIYLQNGSTSNSSLLFARSNSQVRQQWELSLRLVYLLNGQAVEVPVGVTHKTFNSREECVEVGRHYRSAPIKTRATCYGYQTWGSATQVSWPTGAGYETVEVR